MKTQTFTSFADLQFPHQLKVVPSESLFLPPWEPQEPVNEPRSGFKSPAEHDRLCSPIQGGNKPPSKMGTSSFRSLDPNFARTVNDKEKTVKVAVSQKVKFMVEQAKINPPVIKFKTKKTVKTPHYVETIDLTGIDF